MKLVSWNVNGLRAAERKGFLDWLHRASPDVLCLQETKADPEQLSDAVKHPEGFHAFYSSCRTRKGYSGVALYAKVKPEHVEYGMGIERFDAEGRIVVGYFKDFVLFNVYFPNGGGGPERLAYKLDFYDAFLAHIERVRKHGKPIIFCGDVNTAHEEIDLARPKENEKNTGFLPEERAWIDEVVYHGYVDTFRHVHPNKTGAYSYWDMKTRARERNVGWRIDYVFVSGDLISRVRGAGISANVEGSDHCPIWVDLA